MSGEAGSAPKDGPSGGPGERPGGEARRHPMRRPWRGVSAYRFAPGFTLVELLVVLIIIAVGSSLVFVRIGRGLGADPSRRFAVEFSQLVRKGRTQALWDGVPVAVCIDPAARVVSLSEGRGSLAIPETIRIEADGLLRSAWGHACTVLYPDGSSAGGMFKISKDRIVLARLQLDTVTGALVPYRVEP